MPPQRRMAIMESPNISEKHQYFGKAPRHSFQVNETPERRTPFAHYKDVLHECHAVQYKNGTTRAV